MLLIPTDEIPQLIDAGFSAFVNPCNDLIVRHDGLVNEVYSQERKRDVLYIPNLGVEWSPDNSASFQTVHIVSTGSKEATEQFGTFEQGNYDIRAIYAVLHFDTTPYYLETLRAIEAVEGVSVVSLDLRTMSVLRGAFRLKPDENFNLPPYLSAWSITYEMKNVGFYG